MREIRPIRLAALVLAVACGCAVDSGPDTVAAPQLATDRIDGTWRWSLGPLVSRQGCCCAIG